MDAPRNIILGGWGGESINCLEQTKTFTDVYPNNQIFLFRNRGGGMSPLAIPSGPL